MCLYKATLRPCSHISHGSVHRLSNVLIPGYERSERLELPNPASSSRQINPLEPDFSQVSDLSVMIEPPNSNDLSISRPSRKDQSKREHKSKKRRRHRSSSSSISTSRSDSLSSSRRKKNSKRSKHSHKKRRRRSMMPPSSSNSSQSQLDIGRYTRAHKSPQVAQTTTPIQPEETNFSPITNQPINYDQFQPNLTQQNKESDSETESEVWSFDRAINEVFRLLPPELCPKTQQDQAPLKPLSGIEQLMESRSTPLLVLPQSKLVENTTKYIQNRLDSDKCSRDWICPQSLVSALAPTKFYKSQNQYLPTDNIPQLEADASLLDISNKGRASIPLKNLEAWERKARKLVSINSHADLFSSAAFLSLQQESMSVAALYRLLEAVAKSIKHATAMSTLLTTELFQARRDAALASSKLLLDNSTYELRNAPINSKSVFDGRIKEIAKSYFEAQQQRFLASTSIQSQSHSFKLLRRAELSRYLNILLNKQHPDLSLRNRLGPKIFLKAHLLTLRKIISRGLVTSVSSPPLNLPLPPQDYEGPPFPLPALPLADIPVGERLTHFAGKWEEITDNKWVLSIVRNGFRIPFIKIPPLSSVPIRMSQSFSPFLREEIENLLNKRAVERVQNPGTPGFYSRIFLVPKKNGKFRLILDLSLLNRYIEKQAFKMEIVKSVRQAMRLNDWAVSIDLTDAYLHVPIHHQSRKYLRFVHEDQVYHFSALPFGMSLSPLIFSKLMDVIAAFLRQRAISVFPYLDDWLIKNLIRNRLITQTKICIQTIQSLGFLPNLKKSDLFPAQKFTFIGMEFLTQQNLVRVPADRVQNLILTIKKIMSAKHVSARTFLSLLGKLSAADLVLLGRLHLRPLQMCLLSVWKPHILPLDHPISINGMIRSHLQWWINPIRFETGTSIHPSDPEFFLYTDASHYRWGAHLEPTTLFFHGRWTENQFQLHINMLEMMAAFLAIRLALKQAKTFIHHSCIMISTDNTTAVSYINKQGGTHSPNLCVEVWKILNWCLEQDIVIRVRHISIPDDLTNLSRQNGLWIKQLRIQYSRCSKCGSVCDKIQPQTPITCLSSTRLQSTSDRCPVHGLESSSCICFSSFYSDTCCSRENPTTSVQNSSHSSVLATTSGSQNFFFY